MLLESLWATQVEPTLQDLVPSSLRRHCQRNYFSQGMASILLCSRQPLCTINGTVEASVAFWSFRRRQQDLHHCSVSKNEHQCITLKLPRPEPKLEQDCQPNLLVTRSSHSSTLLPEWQEECQNIPRLECRPYHRQYQWLNTIRENRAFSRGILSSRFQKCVGRRSIYWNIRIKVPETYSHNIFDSPPQSQFPIIMSIVSNQAQQILSVHSHDV